MLSMFYINTMVHQPLKTWPYSSKNKNICTQFFLMLLTDQGKKIVREHQGNRDSQEVYAKLSVRALKSTKPLLNSYKFITSITSACVGGVS